MIETEAETEARHGPGYPDVQPRAQWAAIGGAMPARLNPKTLERVLNMPFRIKRNEIKRNEIKRNESVQAAIRRIADEQLGRGLDEIADPDLGRHKTVHQVRKRCKKLRGLIRLVRPAFEQRYQRENAALRDAAGLLSDIRDAATSISTYDDLMDRFGDQVKRSAFGPLRARMTRRLNDIPEQRIDDRLQRVAEAFETVRGRLDRWTLDEDGFAAIAGGLSKTRSRATKRLAEARQTPSAEALHELRKRVKYHWYHMRLLRDLWPAVQRAWAKELDRLSDLLGDDHDHAVFAGQIDSFAGEGVCATDRGVLHGLIEQRRQQLQARAFRSAALLFAESNQAFIGRMNAYWDAVGFADQRPSDRCA